MYNILVTGAKGQVASEIRALSISTAYTYFFTDKKTLDIRDKKAVLAYVEEYKIDTIINCSAYTNVDKAEIEKEEANSVNHLAVKYLGEIAKEKALRLIHISTDYVFDGKNYRPYVENDPLAPQGVYAKTKLRGEEALQKINPTNTIIIRSSWIYSSFGNNFVKTMLKLAKERESLGVIFDQVGTPTYAKDLAQAILDILPQLNNQNVEIYHYSNEGVLSWYDFAKEIMKMSKISCQINPIESKDYPTPASRPHYSLLNKAKIKKSFNINIPYWKDGLDACLREMGERK